jgi:hypothetical protein
MAQYIAVGMSVNPRDGPSTMYIIAPISTTSVITAKRKTKIFLRLARSAPVITPASARYSVSFRMRKMRSSRSTRMVRKNCAPGTNRASHVGAMASRSMMPRKLRA